MKSYKERWQEHFTAFEEQFPDASFDWLAEMADEAATEEEADLVDQAYEQLRDKELNK